MYDEISIPARLRPSKEYVLGSEKACLASHGYFVCTREREHSGEHVAGLSDTMCLSIDADGWYSA